MSCPIFQLFFDFFLNIPHGERKEIAYSIGYRIEAVCAQFPTPFDPCQRDNLFSAVQFGHFINVKLTQSSCKHGC